MEQFAINTTLIIGWPILIIMSFLIIKRSRNFSKRLKGTVIGKLMTPTVFGLLFGMFSLGIVATFYMFAVPWYFVVPPIFLLFLVTIIIIYKAMRTWEKEAIELKDFYHNLEKLVKKRTAELEKSQKKAMAHEKEIQKLKDQFVFIAAHELKAPVTSIRWGIENILEEGENLKPEVKEMLVDVSNSNKRLIDLVNDLLNVARIEAGTIKIDAKQIDINQNIEEALSEMKGMFKKEDISIEYKPNFLSEVFADPARVKQVLINLLSNAVKYNKKKGSITIETKKVGNFVNISVSDTGFGIAKKDLKKMFTKFGRIDNKNTRDVSGTGLGMYLSKEIVTKMGGQIKVDSVEGKGSAFSFTLPLKNNTHV